MRSYRPDELFDAGGRLQPELAALAPKGTRRMGANPHANGGLLLKDLDLPDYKGFAVNVPAPGATAAQSTREMGRFVREVVRRNAAARNFRLFALDEPYSNRWQDVLGVTARQFVAERYPTDEGWRPTAG